MNRNDDYDSDEERRKEDAMPKFRIRHNDMPIKAMKEIVTFANEACKKHQLDKDIAVAVVKMIKQHNAPPKKDDTFEKMGQGDWQCVVGRNFGCSLTFDSKVLTFFDLLAAGKTFLVFKSG